MRVAVLSFVVKDMPCELYWELMQVRASVSTSTKLLASYELGLGLGGVSETTCHIVGMPHLLTYRFRCVTLAWCRVT